MLWACVQSRPAAFALSFKATVCVHDLVLQRLNQHCFCSTLRRLRRVMLKAEHGFATDMESSFAVCMLFAVLCGVCVWPRWASYCSIAGTATRNLRLRNHAQTCFHGSPEQAVRLNTRVLWTFRKRRVSPCLTRAQTARSGRRAT
jgi:hypothetical protein